MPHVAHIALLPHASDDDNLPVGRERKPEVPAGREATLRAHRTPRAQSEIHDQEARPSDGEEPQATAEDRPAVFPLLLVGHPTLPVLPQPVFHQVHIDMPGLAAFLHDPNQLVPVQDLVWVAAEHARAEERATRALWATAPLPLLLLAAPPRAARAARAAPRATRAAAVFEAARAPRASERVARAARVSAGVSSGTVAALASAAPWAPL
mmetsp:Transcript_87636/g.268164  ORF Transcript_87636/g.268164 Transcript_87636/m.268164 type:complete len:209 (+) Transcript_87636:976-1602(+)